MGYLAQQRQGFDEKFGELVDKYVDSYSGDQPIIIWRSDTTKPIVHDEFLNHLPDNIRNKVFQIIEKIS